MNDNSLIQAAMEAFRSGNLDAAKSVSIQLIRSGRLAINRTPYIKSELLGIMHLYFLGDLNQAYERVCKLLLVDSGNYDILKMCHFLLDDNSRTNPDAKYVFGLGTGRSGSTTLTAMIQRFGGSYASHEHRPHITWESGHSTVDWHLRRMQMLSAKFSVVADVSHWWLPYVDYIIEKIPAALFISIKRDREETVNSFIQAKGDDVKGSLNHWLDHKGDFYQKTEWDESYPHFKKDKKRNLIYRYWDEYYDKCENYAWKYPDNFKCMNLMDLCSANGFDAIGRFMGSELPVDLEVPHLNAMTFRDGANMVQNPFPRD